MMTQDKGEKQPPRRFVPPPPSVLERGDPHLLAVRAAANAIRINDSEMSADIGKARLKLFDALKADDAEAASAWMNALEASILVVDQKNPVMVPLARAMKALRVLVDGMAPPPG